MNSNNEDAKKMDVILDKDLDNVSGGFESLSYKNNEKIRNMWSTYAIHEDDNDQTEFVRQAPDFSDNSNPMKNYNKIVPKKED